MDFCQARKPFGLGVTPEELQARISKAMAATTPENAAKGQGERTDLGTVPKSSQTDRAEANGITRRTQGRLDRIARERPDLKAEIVAGRLSVKKAAQIAGFEPERMSVPVEPEQLAAALVKRYDTRQLAELVAALLKHLTGDGEPQP